MRALVVLVGVAVIAGGCLFPSFDDFGGTEKAKGSSSGSSSSSSSSGSTSSTSSSSSSSGATADAGADAGPTIACGDEACLLPGDFCCTTIGGPTCESNDYVDTCGIQGGDAFACDGSDDCPAGEVCCVKDGDATCEATCAGTVLCNGPNSTCPAGKSCTGKRDIFKACQ